jgi:transcriptional regulator with XRE-family HTH domain
MAEDLELVVLGAAIRQVREDRGQSVDALAVAVGSTSADVEAFEAGCLDPGYHRLRRLAAALGITSAALLLRVEEDDATPAGGRNGGGVTAEHDRSEHDRAMRLAFGRRLWEVRTRRGLSQDDLARETGVHPTAISRFERDLREPRLKSVLLLARGLGVKPGELVEGLDCPMS